METKVLKSEYREYDGVQKLVLTAETAETKTEVLRKIAQLYYQLAGVEEQLAQNPGNEPLQIQKNAYLEAIATYEGYRNGFAED